jgi:WD40 repeat protein
MEKCLSPGQLITRLGHGIQKLGSSSLCSMGTPTSTVFGIAISPNGRILASASWDNTARLWNLENSQPISSPLQHVDYVTSVSFSADGKLLSTGCDDENVYTWDVSAILKEAGLDNLLLDQPNKSLLAVRETFIKSSRCSRILG